MYKMPKSRDPNIPWELNYSRQRKISLKYKKQRLEGRYGSSVVNSPDSSYVTRFWKTDQVVSNSISSNNDFKY